MNVAPYVSFAAAKMLARARGQPGRFLANFLSTSRGQFMLARLNVNRSEFITAFRAKPGNPQELGAALSAAALHAEHRGHLRIEMPDMLVALADEYPVFKNLLFAKEVGKDDIETIAHWEDRMYHDRLRQKKFWRKDAILSVPPLGRDWAAGYSVTLDRYSHELGRGHLAGSAAFHVIGHTRQIEVLERALAKAAENNALLIGEEGVGKNTIILGLSRRIISGHSKGNLNWKRVLELDIGGAVAGLKTGGEIEERIRKIFSEAEKAGNIILVVHNFHTYLGSHTIAGMVDISGIILPFIRGTRLQFIGLTTPSGFRETVGRREDLLPFFEQIEVHEPTQKETVQILADVLSTLERRYNVFVTMQSLRACVEYADRYIQDIPFPEKAVQLLQSSVIAAQASGEKVVTPERIAHVISERTEIPIGAVTEQEQQKLLHLEEFIHQRIVDQEEAVNVIANAMRRARAGVGAGRKRPLGGFLFLGPTGVGKTETAKALAEAYFGSQDRMIRLDMSEYQNQESIGRFLGSAVTHEEGKLPTAIRDAPFSLVLFDEFEKAHPKILDLFLQVFDEGRLTDGWGRTVSFTNAILIATSNAGAEFIREYLKSGKDVKALSVALREEILQRSVFKPEMLNRFDAVVVFRPLSQEHVHRIAYLMIKSLSKNLLKERGITVEAGADTIGALADKGFSWEFGARELRRVIQEAVENVIAKKIIAGELKRGDTFVVQKEDVAHVG